MDLRLLESPVVYIVVLICSTAVSGQTCSNDAFLDPLNVESYNQSRLVPLLGRHETLGREQWIFLDLEFTCRGMLTKWIFRGLPDQDIGVELATWRLNTRSNFFTSYDRVSTTERNAGRPTRNGAAFTYELISPVEVLPGDIVGIEMGFISFGGTSNNVIALNTSGSGSTSTSYRTSGGGPSFILQSPSNIRERDIVPLLQAVIEPLQESTMATDLSTQSTTAMGLSIDLPTTAIDLPTDSVQTVGASAMLPTMTVASTGQDDMGGKSTVAIVAGACGGITGILIVAILCVCIACITKRIQVHVHYDGEEKFDSRHQENTSGTVLPMMNTANRQAVSTSKIGPIQNQTTTTSNGHSMQNNLAYGSQAKMYEGTETGSTGDYERMSGYLAFHHSNLTHREEGTCSHLALPMVHVMPVQQ